MNIIQLRNAFQKRERDKPSKDEYIDIDIASDHWHHELTVSELSKKYNVPVWRVIKALKDYIY